jgi:hypothetical protein
MFEQARSAIDALKRVAYGLEAGCLDGSDAAVLSQLATEGERVCGAIKALAVRRPGRSAIPTEGDIARWERWRETEANLVE